MSKGPEASYVPEKQVHFGLRVTEDKAGKYVFISLEDLECYMQ